MTSVLVVDDDPFMVRTLCDVLRRRGYETGSAGSGEEAVASAEARHWSAVVMDIRMPGMNGVAASKVLRGLQPDLLVILMTAHSESHLLEEARAAGVASVLNKPFPIPQLLAVLDGKQDQTR